VPGSSSTTARPPVSANTNVPQQVASATSEAGRKTASTVGAVTNNLGAGASNISPQLGAGVQTTGDTVQETVVKVADGIASLLGSVSGK
jgi:hypothetical protein